jgi:hypothetical protein
MNFEKPTPIQAATIPIALLGRDICACAVTGSGKVNKVKVIYKTGFAKLLKNLPDIRSDKLSILV